MKRIYRPFWEWEDLEMWLDVSTIRLDAKRCKRRLAKKRARLSGSRVAG